MMTPDKFADDFILRWEDGNSTNPNKTHSMLRMDAGNWSSGIVGVGNFIGSNHGVTAAALAEHRKVSVDSITVAIMHALTADEAGDIAIEGYYKINHLDRLPWNAVTASVFDFGWGAGKFKTVMKLQGLIGANIDGQIGPATVDRYNAWLDAQSLDTAARAWAALRNHYYDEVIAAKPYNMKFRDGWRNRTAYFLPSHPEGWWDRFNA